MPGYIENLKRWAAERHAATAAQRARNARSLEEKIREWFAALPPEEQRRNYLMSELVETFNAAPGRIGVALHRLRWQRARRWGEGVYSRYWIPASHD